MKFLEIAVDKIEPSPYQPRKSVSKDYIQQLSDSVDSHGLINPITVKCLPNGNYQIITGEMRWRAHQLANIKTISAFVKVISKENHQKESLIENIHRLDLNMEEKGLGVYAYFKTKGITLSPKKLANNIHTARSKKKKLAQHERNILDVCKELSVSSSSIERWLDFLSVPQEIRTMELSRPQSDQQQTIIARLSTMEDNPELQKLTYLKIRKDDMGVKSASKFITAIKKMAKDDLDKAKAYTVSDIKFDITDTPKGYTITIPQDELERIQMTATEHYNALTEIAKKPITWERQFHTRNWGGHQGIIDLSEDLMCPFCGEGAEKHLGWKCKPDKNIKDCFKQSEKNYENAQDREDANLLFLKGMKRK